MAPAVIQENHSLSNDDSTRFRPSKLVHTNGNATSSNNLKTPKPDLTPGPSTPEPLAEKTAAGPHLDASYNIVERPIGTRRRIRVVCMGAGYSGLMMAMVFSERMKDKNAELVIYERNDDLGGTWLENRYVSERFEMVEMGLLTGIS